ncbi:hypothetical protein IWQ61_006435 [Dispira simplex]|nr:hypothetical protein IWQ61_006435 [Dispira simplex]
MRWSKSTVGSARPGFTLRKAVVLGWLCLQGVHCAQHPATRDTPSYSLNINTFANCDANLPIQFNAPVAEYIENTNSFELKLSAENSERLTGGVVDIDLSVVDTSITSTSEDACKLAATSCPIGPGHLEIEKTITVPGALVSAAKTALSIPGITLEGRVVIQEGENVMGCLTFGLESAKSFQQPVVVGISLALLALAVLLSLAASLAVRSSDDNKPGTTSAQPTRSSGDVIPDNLLAHSSTVDMTPTEMADTFSGHAPNVLELMFLLQFLALSGAFSLNYPSFYQQFTSNFSWAIGIAHLKFLDPVYQRLIPVETLPSNITRSSTTPSVVQQLDTNTIGIEKYAALAGLPRQHIFIGTFSLFIFLIILAVVMCAVVRIGVWLFTKYRPFRFMVLRRYYWHWSLGHFLRVFILSYLPLAAVSFALLIYLPQEPGEVALAYIFLIGFCVLFVIVLCFIIFRKGVTQLYHYAPYLYSYGPLYSHYHPKSYWFFGLVFAYKLVQAVTLGTAVRAHIVQVSLMVANELVMLLLMLLRQPFVRRLDRNVNIFVGLIRLICSGLLFVFIKEVHVSGIVKLVVAIVCLVLQLVALLCYVGLLFYNTFVLIKEGVKGTSPGSKDSELASTTKLENSTSPYGSKGDLETPQSYSSPSFTSGSLSPTLTRDRSLARHGPYQRVAPYPNDLPNYSNRGDTLLSPLPYGGLTAVSDHRRRASPLRRTPQEETYSPGAIPGSSITSNTHLFTNSSDYSQGNRQHSGASGPHHLLRTHSPKTSPVTVSDMVPPPTTNHSDESDSDTSDGDQEESLIPPGNSIARAESPQFFHTVTSEDISTTRN